jgi:indolepyruvate ferredoxin oxidoreductase
MFMLGYTWQKGLIPLDDSALLRAIELNAEAVRMNQAAFLWGRREAHNSAAVEAIAAPLRGRAASQGLSHSLEEVIARRVSYLTAYQNKAYARRYLALVRRVEKAERACLPRSHDLAEAAARYYFKFLAIKDEYEVARLYSDGFFAKQIGAAFEDSPRLEYHLAPPILGRKNALGEPMKSSFGPWMMPLFRALASLKWLRGTPFDIFGYTMERRVERRLIADYENLIEEIRASLTPENHAVAVALASIPEKIRGFGHVKTRHLQAAKAEERSLLEQFRAGPAPVKIAAE